MRKVVSTLWSISVLFVASLCLGLPGVAYGQSVEDDLRLQTDVDGEEIIAPPPPTSVTAITVADDDVAPPRRKRRVVEDAYAPTGLDLGAFQLFPTLEISSVVTSNVGRNKINDGDVGLRFKPGFRLESDWLRHQLNLSGSADVLNYLDRQDLATQAGSLDGSFRLDVRRDTRADFALNYGLTSTGAESTEVPDSATGARLDQTIGASVGITHEIGRLEGTAKLGLTQNLFGDVSLVGGGTENNKDRDFTQLSLSLRGSFKTGALIAPFAEVAYEPRWHTKEIDRNGVKRNSHGLRLLAGVSISDDPLWSGEIAATAQLRDYADSSLQSSFAPGLATSINWRPTDLTRFEFNSGVSLAETIAAGSSGIRSWNAGVSVVHALRDNLDFNSGVAFTYDDSNAGNSLTTTVRFGFDWDVNPYLSVSTGYQGTWVNGITSAGDYNEQQALTSIVLKR